MTYYPEFPNALERAIRRVAQERHLRVAFDTHYDAGNCEIQWWRGKTRYRLDFQAYQESFLRVTLYQDDFPFLPKLLAWSWRTIPMFPYVAKVSYRSLGDVRGGESEDFYVQRVRGLIDSARTCAKAA